MKRIRSSVCPVCGSSGVRKTLVCRDYFVSGETFEIWKCSECGFGYTQDFVSEEEVGPYYEAESYVSHSDSGESLLNKIYHIARRTMIRSKVRLIESAAAHKRGSLLDIGCGTGYFLSAMRQAGWQVTGVEKSEVASRRCRESFDLNVFSEMRELEQSDERFEVITMWHVLEHIQDLSALRDFLQSKLSQNGTVVIAIPNAESYDARTYQEYWAAYDVPRHLWHFTFGSFSHWASQSGFTIEKVRIMPFDPFYISWMSEQYRGSSCSLLKGMVRGAIGWSRSLVRKSESSSLIYVLKRSAESKNSTLK